MRAPLPIQLTLMVAYAFTGAVLALSHHFYYISLHGKQNGSATRQEWATTFGTAFSFLVVALFRSAVAEAYNQYIWTIVKRRSFGLGSLDRLFAMTSNLLGFLSWELLANAKVALIIALAVWYVKGLARVLLESELT